VGEKSIILPILEWLLKERQLLEKRAYLGKYLMKIEVPGALRGDSNFEELYENVSLNNTSLYTSCPCKYVVVKYSGGLLNSKKAVTEYQCSKTSF